MAVATTTALLAAGVATAASATAIGVAGVKKASEKRKAAEAVASSRVTSSAAGERTARLQAQAARDRLLTGNPNILSNNTGGPTSSGRLLGN